MILHCIQGLQGKGIQLLPLRRQVSTGSEVQLQCLREQDPIWVRRLATRLEIQTAADQSAVIVQRAAELQKQPQRFPLATAIGNDPTAGGVEEVSLMHELPIHPEPHPLSPPAQGETSATFTRPTPALRPGQILLKTDPATSARPDQKSARSPVRTVLLAPGITEMGRAITGAAAPPASLQIEA
jgi:hypothetical protein